MIRALGLLFALALSASPAQAQDDSARGLFEQAMEARRQDELQLAEELLTRSLELDPRSATMFNLAEVRGRLGKHCSAVQLCRALREGRYGELAPEQLAEVASRERQSLAQTATVSVRVEGARAARLRVDANAPRSVGGGDAQTMCLDAGDHVLVASAAGRMTVERALTVEGGTTPEVALTLLPLAEGGSVVEEPAFWLALGAVLLAGVGITLGVVFGTEEDRVVDPVFGNKATLTQWLGLGARW